MPNTEAHWELPRPQWVNVRINKIETVSVGRLIAVLHGEMNRNALGLTDRQHFAGTYLRSGLAAGLRNIQHCMSVAYGFLGQNQRM